MTALEEALEAGRAAQGKNPKWEPVGVDYPGWLTARVRRVGEDEVEGIFYAQGAYQFRKLGKDSEGKVKSYDVRERELKRVVKAMIGPDAPHRGALIQECFEARQAARNGEPEKPKKRRRRARRKK